MNKTEIKNKIIARQGSVKLKFPLIEFRKQAWIEEIEQPEYVYHMTDAENLESILEDGKIKTFNDFLTFFSTSPVKLASYLELTGALVRGRTTYRTDGSLVCLPPIDVDEKIVLKLKPACKEPLNWYREIKEGFLPGVGFSERVGKVLAWMDEACICHYGDMQFSSEDIEVIKLKDMLENLSDEDKLFLDEIRNIQRCVV